MHIQSNLHAHHEQRLEHIKRLKGLYLLWGWFVGCELLMFSNVEERERELGHINSRARMVVGEIYFVAMENKKVLINRVGNFVKVHVFYFFSFLPSSRCEHTAYNSMINWV